MAALLDRLSPRFKLVFLSVVSVTAVLTAMGWFQEALRARLRTQLALTLAQIALVDLALVAMAAGGAVRLGHGARRGRERPGPGRRGAGSPGPHRP
jgi:hypothetical protein